MIDNYKHDSLYAKYSFVTTCKPNKLFCSILLYSFLLYFMSEYKKKYQEEEYVQMIWENDNRPIGISSPS